MWYFSTVVFFKKWKTRLSNAFSFALSVDMWKPYTRQVNCLTDGIQNWFYLHLLSSWLDLANGDCMRWMSNWSLYRQVHFGWEWWPEPRHTSAIHVDVTLHSTLLMQTNSSFCKAVEFWVKVEKKKDQKSTSDCYHLALFSKLLRKTWVIKAFISRYLGTVSTDYFLLLSLFPQYFPSSVDFSSCEGSFLSSRKLSLWT